KEDDLWNKILPKGLNDTSWVDIATYNFNFVDQFNNTFYNKLRELSNTGVQIRLVYAKEKDGIEMLDDFVVNSVAIFKNPHNHSKILLTENLGYVGSSNFSFGSNNNYEAGVLIRDRKLIKELKSKLFINLFKDGEWITHAQPDWLYEHINYLIKTTDELLRYFQQPEPLDQPTDILAEQFSNLKEEFFYHYGQKIYYSIILNTIYEAQKKYDRTFEFLCFEKHQKKFLEEQLGLFFEKDESVIRKITNYFLEVYFYNEVSWDLADITHEELEELYYYVEYLRGFSNNAK